MSSRAAVTGASGFIGSHLVQHLSKLGTEVAAIPRHVLAESNQLSQWFNDFQPTQIYHVAGLSLGDLSSSLLEANVQLAARILESTRQGKLIGVPILVVGSAAEFGRIQPSDLPIQETHEPAPASSYGLSKCMQTLLAEAAIRDGRKIINARPFNVIGPGMPKHLVPQTFIDQLVHVRSRGQRVLHVGNLKSKRDFISVDQVAKIFAELLGNPGAWGKTVNICTGKPLSVETIVLDLVGRFGGDICVEEDPARVRQIDVPVHYGSTQLLESLIGYCPNLDYERVLDKLISGVAQT